MGVQRKSELKSELKAERIRSERLFQALEERDRQIERLSMDLHRSQEARLDLDDRLEEAKAHIQGMSVRLAAVLEAASPDREIVRIAGDSTEVALAVESNEDGVRLIPPTSGEDLRRISWEAARAILKYAHE